MNADKKERAFCTTQEEYTPRISWGSSDRTRSKYSIVGTKPSFNGTVGCQASFCGAKDMSGWRWNGSTWGSGWWTISDREAVSEITRSANSRIVNSFGLPMLTGLV